MAVSMPSGLGASLGYVAESTVGTFTTSSMRWSRFQKEGFVNNKTTVQGVGLHQGLYSESKRRALVQKDVNGSVTFDLQTTQLGVLFKHMLGVNTTGVNGTAVQVGGTAAYKQIHAPGDNLGLGLSFQVGRPLSSGTIQQFNYSGCKVMDWTLAVARGQLATLDLTLDGWAEEVSTAYAAPSLTNINAFDFSQGAFKIGGTPSTTSGLTSISGNAAPVGTVQSVSIKGTNPMKQDRYTIGATTKREQLASGFRSIEVEAQVEFASLADFYTSLFVTDTAQAVQLTLTGAVIAGGNSFYTDVIVPAVFWDQDPVLVQGPDVIVATVKGTGLDNNADNPVQISYQSTDTAL